LSVGKRALRRRALELARAEARSPRLAGAFAERATSRAVFVAPHRQLQNLADLRL